MRLKHLSIAFCGVIAVMLCRPAISSSDTIDSPPPAHADAPDGRVLFLKNCAHCHAADARGDEGPDLHKLELSDEWIGNRIRKGKAGEMTAFAGKLKDAEINALVKYVQSLR
jgi:mono/diheme cytochrome c family protein